MAHGIFVLFLISGCILFLFLERNMRIQAIIVKPIIPPAPPQESMWKKVGVAAIPILGALQGMVINRQLQSKLEREEDARARRVMLVDSCDFHGSVSLNLFAYGVAAMAYGIEYGNPAILAGGVTQLIYSAKEFCEMKRVFERISFRGV